MRPLRPIVFAALAALTPIPSVDSASAQDFAGAMSGQLVLNDAEPTDVGAAGTLELWAAFDWLRLGGFVGVAALPSETDPRNVTFMPFGFSSAFRGMPNEWLIVELRLRAGGWGGATQSEKLTAGVYVGGGPKLSFAIGGGAAIGVGIDLAGLLASDLWTEPTAPDQLPSSSQLLIMPTIGLSWGPANDDDSDAYFYEND